MTLDDAYATLQRRAETLGVEYREDGSADYAAVAEDERGDAQALVACLLRDRRTMPQRHVGMALACLVDDEAALAEQRSRPMPEWVQALAMVASTWRASKLRTSGAQITMTRDDLEDLIAACHQERD